MPYPSKKIWRICAYTSLKTTKKQDSIRRIQKNSIRRIQVMECKDSGRYRTWSLLQETPDTLVFIQLINTAYSLLLNTAYRSSDTVVHDKEFNKRTIHAKDPEREFRSSRKHFKALSLDESRSPNFNLVSDQEEYSEEEATETMAETMEKYMSKTRADYESGITRPKIEDKDSFELKG
ncbi:hypothetical protein Tco_0152053 [Tanacetum coccineum]